MTRTAVRLAPNHSGGGRPARRGPIAPLVRARPELRRYLAAVGVAGALTAILIVVQAGALAHLVAAGVTGRLDRAALVTVLLAVAVRAALRLGQGVLAARTAAGVKRALRGEVLAAVSTPEPVAAGRGVPAAAGRGGAQPDATAKHGEVATLVGRGVDALDPYLTGYLPQLILGVTVPLAVLARLAFADPTSAVVVAVTLPLIPIFAILVGWHTERRTIRQWRLLATLGGHFLDMLSGMTTLRAFGRDRAQVDVVGRMAERYRSATMATLRVAFLSALVLELVATVSVALVAVPVGLRLLDGALTLPVALLVLLLAPEAYLPLRAAGAQFHASQEGLAAAQSCFDLLDQRSAGVVGLASVGGAVANARVPDPGRCDIVFDRVDAGYGDRTVLRAIDLVIGAGSRLALSGPSGGGKSTLLALLLGFAAPTHGRILVGGTDLAAIDVAAWRCRLAWVPQRPHLFAASVADNIRLGAPHTDLALVHAAATAAHADFIHTLPDGYATMLGEDGYGCSSGQRQRIALARAYLRTSAGLVLLDEPTARLDAESEAAVVAASTGLINAPARTTVLVAHRPALLKLAGRVLRVADGHVREVPVREVSTRAVPTRAVPAGSAQDVAV